MTAQRYRYLNRLTSKVRPHWWAHMQRIVNGERAYVFSKRFYDHEWGGRKAALEAALSYRDDHVAQAPASSRGVLPGHGYVRRTKVQGRPVWEGWVKLEGGRHLRTKWFIDVWGAKAAKLGCTAWLARHRLEIDERAALAAGKGRRRAV